MTGTSSLQTTCKTGKKFHPDFIGMWNACNSTAERATGEFTGAIAQPRTPRTLNLTLH
ncbi:MAG TPA: hypothetical protein V6D26_14850 [Stenomitos sp.]